MQSNATQESKPPLYPYHEWEIVEDSFDAESNLQDETIFALGNGYIGIRGNFEEGYNGPSGTSVEGTYLNGFYETEPIFYGEDGHGYARYSQTMLNVTNSKIIKLELDGEPFDLFQGHILSYKRTLDMKNGILIRNVLWQSASGKQIQLNVRRIVSLVNKHLAAISYEVVPLNFDGTITIRSVLDGQVRNQVTTGDPRTGSALSGQVLLTEGKVQDGTFAALLQRTINTRFALVCAMENRLETSAEYEFETIATEQQVTVQYKISARQGETVRLNKYIAYFTSKHTSESDVPEHKIETNLTERVKQTVVEAKRRGFEELIADQQMFLRNYWQRSDVEIRGDLALQQSIRFNAFHLLQAVGRDGKTNIGAKGLTGEGYEGHYFWDTETYVFPFFLYTHPEIGKKLLEYRYSILDKARVRAREMSQKGALYPWRTIGGEETSAYYPAGTAQYHINADIIHALRKYMTATNDMVFFLTAGAEMLFETARLWADLGDYIPRKGNRFCINNVTGPDEYTAIVNNNLYTNLMAKDHLEYAWIMARELQRNHSVEYRALAERIKLQEKEIEEWKRAADMMYIPYDEKLGIHPQDDSFLEKAVWDFANTPPENYPLLLHYHPLVIYRYQVLKQADVVLALFLQGNRFTQAEKKRNFDYYEPITTHDSSLSPCSYSIIAAELGYLQRAYDYFMRTARMDLDDYNGNVKDGVHTAAMAGAWLSIVNGFAGFREYDGQLHFNPVVPEPLDGYRFTITFQSRLLEIDVTKENATYTLLEGEPLTIRHGHQPLLLQTGCNITVSLLRTLEAVIFDLDGVITDTAEYHYQAWQRLADEIGVPFDRNQNEQLKGIGRMESLERILQPTGQLYSEQEKAEWAARKNRYYLELIGQMTPQDVLPGVTELLIQLQANGIKIGLASASKNALTVIDKLQIRHYFDVIVDAAALKKGKPDPEIFMTAAEMLQVSCKNCVGIEDAESGTQAIKAANMFAVGVGNPLALGEADWVVSDTAELTFAKLQNMLSGKGYYLKQQV